MGYANHGHFQNSGVAIQDVFNFRWVNVFTAGNNEVFESVKEIDVAIGIQISRVACSQPTAFKQCFSGILGLIPIALHDHLAAQPNLTHLPCGHIVHGVRIYHPHIHPRQCPAYRAEKRRTWALGFMVSGWQHHHRACSFGHAIGLHELTA